MDIKLNQLETRVATLDLMIVAERARPQPNKAELAKLEQQLSDARSALEKYKKQA